MLAEEKRTGTLESLLTRPLSDFQIIFGKYLAALTLVIFAILPTLVYYYSVFQLGIPNGNLDTPGIIGSYIGLVLLGGVFTSIGLFSSALSENQIVAFIIAVFFSFFMFSGVSSISGLFSGQTGLYVEEMSLSYHYDAMSRGLIDTRNLVFFFSTIAVLLLLTSLKFAARKMVFKPFRNRSLKLFLLGILVVLFFNIIAANFFLRIDLTQEKRYTLQASTKDLLSKLDQPLTIEILMGDDLPNGFQRFRKSIGQTIEEFGIYSNQSIFLATNDPSEADSESERNKNYQTWMERGLSPTRIIDNDNGKEVTKLVFPYAILRYGAKSAAVLLLKGNQGATPEMKLNQSIEGIEYELATGIQRIADINRKKIGLLQGHGELDSLDIYWFARDFIEAYDLEQVDLSKEVEIKPYDAIIMAKPTKKFSREDKYKIDQYIMNGGKAIFMIDALGIDMSQAGNAGTFSLPYDLDLDDLFFRYGVRVEKNAVLDAQNFGRHPVLMDGSGTVTNIRWPYYFGASQFGDHPITKNLDAIYMRFAGSLDTVAAKGIVKTPVVFTSPNTRSFNAPVPVSFEAIFAEKDASAYIGGNKTLAYLLEGKFTSNFKNRILPNEDIKRSSFKDESPNTKILVISDGDIIRNEIKRGTPLDLGLNPFTEGSEKRLFANKDFLANALAYLIDEDGLITARNKEIVLRPLDKLKVQKEKVKWQLVNLVLPLVILMLIGVLLHWLRVRKYARF
jgi:ABC-2 type transport system permease protein